MWMQHERAAQPPESASSTQARKTSFRKPGMMVPQNNLSVQVPQKKDPNRARFRVLAF